MKTKVMYLNFRFKSLILIVLVLNILMGCTPETAPTKPKACFGYIPMEKIKTTDTIKFSNCSENADLFYWDFGDSCYSSEREPKHLFKNKKEYLVKLCASKKDNPQVKDTLSKLINVNIEPKPSFDYKRTSTLSISFKNLSSNATEYFWSFGDGTSSTEKEPTHIYNKYGTYKVTLTTKNDWISDSISQVIDLSDIVNLNNLTIKSIFSGGTDIDVDFDGIADFNFNEYDHTSPSGSKKYIEFKPLNNYEIITDTTLASYTNLNISTKSHTYKFCIPKIYILGDTIQEPYTTIKNSIYAYYESYDLVGVFNVCDTWKKDEIRYIGIRKIEDNIIKLGWIKLKLYISNNLLEYKMPCITNSLTIKE